MGIIGINKLLQRNAPQAFFTIPITKFSGKRIAIDANNWMYTNMAIARKKIINKTDIANIDPSSNEIRKEWLLMALNFIIGWLNYSITPVFVLDGTHPIEKDDTKAKRRDVRNASKIKIEALTSQIRNNNIEKQYDIIEELRKELRNYNYISTEDFELFKMIIKGIGIPCLQAKGDAEQLCSMLCIEGKVAAVYSSDTDNLVYGCPLIITGINSQMVSYDENGMKVSYLDCVRHDKILQDLQISHSFFVDLCIMCGCDYNTNMPGYAAIKSFDLLKKYGCIEDLPRNFNTECLKYQRCRDIFKYVVSDTIIDLKDDEEKPSLDINRGAIKTSRDYLEMGGVSGQIERIIYAYNNMQPVSDGFIDDLKLNPTIKYVPPSQRVTLIINRPSQQIITIPIPNFAQPVETLQKQVTLNIISK